MRVNSFFGRLFTKTAVIAALSVACSVACFAQQNGVLPAGDESHVGKLTGHSQNAKGTYRRYCVGCHGELGDGEGENAQWLDPRPRDFTLARFKCRSTPTGTLPTDEDLFDTIGRGLDASNMPAWNTLTRQQRADLVAFIKHFSERWQKEKPGAPLLIPSEPEVSADRIKTGRDLYQKLQCWKCHGADGRSKGPDAATLADDQERAIKPFDFVQEHRFKCGSSDADLYRILLTGLDGTPMPSYIDNIKPDETWDLIFYLRSLQPMRTAEKEIANRLRLKPVSMEPTVQPASK
jgi:mono/diheme cytochrome c family protein